MKLIYPIQYLRGIAALMVVAHHATNQIAGVSDHVAFNFGPSGVDLFFVISGFIMVVTTSDLGPQEFMKRRILRVVPLYWLLTISMIGAALVAPGLFKTLRFSTETVVKSLLFIPHHSLGFPGVPWPVLVPGWTLNYEMFFYLIFALSLFLPVALRLGALALVFGVLIALGYALGPFERVELQTYTSPLLFEFICGAAIAHLWFRERVNFPVWMSICTVAMGVFLLVQRDQAPLGYFNQMLGAVLLIVGALNGRFGRWRNRTLLALGDASYSTYLTHIFTLGMVRAVWVKVVPNANTAVAAWTFMVFAMVLCAAIGWLSYRWIELPLLHQFNRRNDRAV